MAETTWNGGNSYGPETAQVQFAVAAQDGALGTIITPNAKRIRHIDIENTEGVSVTIKVQETDTNPNGSEGTPSWSDVAGSSVTIVPGGSQRIDIPGKIQKKYARLYGGPATNPSTGLPYSGTSICRAVIEDLDLLDNFRQNVPYGAG